MSARQPAAPSSNSSRPVVAVTSSDEGMTGKALLGE